MSTIIDKSLIINEIKRHYKIDSDADFARFLGIKPQTLSSWRLRNNIDYDLISSKCSDINMNWVLTGKGNMLNEYKPFTNLTSKNNQTVVQEKNEAYQVLKNPENGPLQMMVPLVSEYAYAGYLNGFSDEKYIGDLPTIPVNVKTQHKGIYRAFNVRGDSMTNRSYESILEGDIAVGRRVDREYWKSKLHLNKWHDFVIVHQDGILIKRIIDHNTETNIITCMSLNEDKEFYPNIKLHLKDVYELFNIVQIIRYRD